MLWALLLLSLASTFLQETGKEKEEGGRGKVEWRQWKKGDEALPVHTADVSQSSEVPDCLLVSCFVGSCPPSTLQFRSKMPQQLAALQSCSPSAQTPKPFRCAGFKLPKDFESLCPTSPLVGSHQWRSAQDTTSHALSSL